MKIDFHTHGKLAKQLYFSKAYTYNNFVMAKANGLDALCLTEHFNTSQFEEVYRYIASISKRKEDALILGNGLIIFPGLEVDVAEGAHILILANIDHILEIHNKLRIYQEPESFITLASLFELLQNYPHILGAAHPFRPGKSGNLPKLSQEELKQFHFVDLNGKDTALFGRNMVQKVEEFAQQLQIPLVAGSDSHHSYQYGCIYNDFENTFYRIDELYAAMRRNEYKIVIQDDIVEKVKTAGYVKHLLKNIDQLGGDYAAVSLERPMD